MASEPAADRPETGARACPICRKPTDADFKPFCSKRCADIDLHKWLRGVYVVPGDEPAVPDEGPDEG